MRTRQLSLALALLAAIVLAPAAFAHCQIPCGIYDDEARFTLLREHATTIEKSIQQIVDIGKSETKDWNQLVRWVENKESHADELCEIVTHYFMTQRIKPPGSDDAAQVKYQHELSLLHQMLVHAMKAKQTTDLAHVAKLRQLIDAFEKSYLGEHGHVH